VALQPAVASLVSAALAQMRQLIEIPCLDSGALVAVAAHDRNGYLGAMLLRTDDANVANEFE